METNQSAADILKLVKEMRDVQKQYFRTRKFDVLHEAQHLETRVDKALAEFEGGQTKMF
jgi:hypothetical protein